MATRKCQLYADQAAWKDFEAFYRRLGMTQSEAGTRLFRWFMEQDEMLRHQILQPLPEPYQRDVATLILKRMRADKP